MCDPNPDELLTWYDAHAREMPWRVGPKARSLGEKPDPYRVWLSEIMLQQTTVAAVRGYFLRFLSLWPRVEDLAAAEDSVVMAEWAGLGYYARARNLLKCARLVVDEFGGRFPEDSKALLGLPGVGPYTAAAIASIAFDRPETVVDGNVERVMARLFLVETPLPKAKPELTKLAASLTPTLRPGDYAQAVMDLGSTVCTPKSPACGICPWMQSCEARKVGRQAELPKKVAKKPKPIRFGAVYLGVRDDGAWLLERRPEKGLLGGMLGWPGGDWSEAPPNTSPPMTADWRELGAEVRHTFTHFHLRLRVHVARLGTDTDPDRGHFEANFDKAALPTVMRKAYDLAIDQMPIPTR